MLEVRPGHCGLLRGRAGVKYSAWILDLIRSLTADQIDSQIRYHEESLGRTQDERGRRILRYNLELLREIRQERWFQDKRS
jgi:hypothetical protein